MNAGGLGNHVSTRRQMSAVLYRFLHGSHVITCLRVTQPIAQQGLKTTRLTRMIIMYDTHSCSCVQPAKWGSSCLKYPKISHTGYTSTCMSGHANLQEIAQAARQDLLSDGIARNDSCHRCMPRHNNHTRWQVVVPASARQLKDGIG